MISFPRSNHHERIVMGVSPYGVGTPVPISGPDAALRLLRDLGREPCGRAALRRLYAEMLGRVAICSDDDRLVLERLVRWLVTGQLKVRSVRLEPVDVPAGALLPVSHAEPVAPAEVPPKDTTWFELQVLWNATGNPIEGVCFAITPQDGSEDEHTTNKQGLVRIEDIKPGACAVRAAGGETATRLVVVSSGRKASSEKDKKKKPKRRPAAYTVVEVEEHKVKSGETPAGLAEGIGISLAALARFNWGTDDPGEIADHLRHDVGCTKTGDQVGSWPLDDTDDPGVILLPKPWKGSCPATERTVLKVDPAPTLGTWMLSI